MSAIRFEQPIYKVFEPGYHTRTIIVDEQIESPETLTIRLEEEAAGNGGDPRGQSPTGLLPMSAYKPQLHGYADSPYSQYSPQSYSTQQSDNAASHINQLAFAANNAAPGQYLAAQATASANINVLSCHPNVGLFGTKVSLKVTSQYELAASTMTAATPYVSIVFGSERCQAQTVKGAQDNNGVCTYTITAEAPEFPSTSCPSLSNVPLTLLVEGANGEEIARASNVGVFSYNDAHGAAGRGVGVGGSGDPASPPDLGSPKTRSPATQRASPPHQSLQAQTESSGTSAHELPSDSATNAYGFPPNTNQVVRAVAQTQQIHAQAQAQTHSQSDFAAATGAYSQGSSNMLASYRNASFPDHYSRAPPLLRSPHGAGWTPFASHMEPGPLRSPAAAISHGSHSSMTRPSLTPVQQSNPATPQLIRTSTLAQPVGPGGSHNPGYNPYALYQTKATLKINGDLCTMAENWTQEEWENRRRLVLFRKQQTGSVLTTRFEPVSISERPPNSTCISCIWWEEKQECFVTSVDTIYLLEQLVTAPGRFSVEEKNRIRRNLEGFHPLTVSKSKAESEGFFKVIMSFGNPKPRNIEKDVKVFPWKTLSQALKKIISKYSASSSSIVPPPSTNSTHLLTPVNVNSSYPLLPPAPGSSSSTTTTSDSAAAAGYMGGGHHLTEPLASPRPVSGSSSWAAYGSSGRTMSPAVKTDSPVSTSGLRISTLPAVYDSRGSMQSLTSPYSMAASAAQHSPHHNQGAYSQAGVPVSQSHARNWEGYSTVADSYPAQASHAHSQVYGGVAYGDGAQRA
ncbi:hypothetical protein B0T19DRAFT_197899 [Cercophora scortea]|uniref:DUF7082 domain-containing protein n=1 Tax=Cercophora scortea TaxID=314031 RepID=A0AAE0IDS7_9PEZI|nr:hypothetical protein B0T19DRAFT_197899 [Cercophora scortea]